MIRVQAYGKILTFPDGTSEEQIQQTLGRDEADLNPDYKPPVPEALDYAKGFAVGANKLVSGVGYLAEAVGADETGKAIREFGDRGAAYWNSKMSPGGKKAAESQVFVDDPDSITGLRLGDDAGKALLMGAAQSLPSMFAAALPGVAITKGIQALASLGLAGGAGATIPLLAGTAAPIGVASQVIARAPAAIGFGAAEGVTSGAMNAAGLKSSIEGMSDKELLKSPVYQALRAQHGEEKARTMLADQAASDLFGKTAVSTGAIGALTGGGALGSAYQKVTSGAADGILMTGLKGAGQEAIQETPQSGGEKYIENITRKEYVDPSIDPMSGVVAEAASGGAIGAFTGGIVGAGSTVNLTKQAEVKAQEINTAKINPIHEAATVDEAIVAANEAVKGKPVTKEDVLRTIDPTLADIEALTGVKPNETQTTTNDTGQAQAAEVLDIVLPDNTSVKAQWKVVDADQLAASMKEDINQPRDRTRAASDVQIKSIANAPDYRRLSDSPVMDVGAPVVDQDGRIVAGNGRFAGLSQAYEQGTATEYMNHLREDAARKGLSIEGIAKPVLVRQLAEPVDTRKMAIASNSGTTLQMSALEQAKLDAERMKGIENLDVNDLGDIALTPRNLTQLKDSLGSYAGTELGAMVDKGGQLSQEGMRRVRNAMLAKAYGTSPVLERLVESTDSDMRNVLGALTKSANHIISTKGDTKALLEAVDTYAQLKATGQPVDNFLAQQDAFSEGLSKEAEDILRFIDTNVRSQKKLTDFIKGNFREVDTTSADMFESKPPNSYIDESKRHPNAKAASKNASWVIKNKSTGEILFETFDKAKVDALNTSKYEAVPIYEYLTGLNKDERITDLEKHLKDNGYDFTVEPASVRDVDALDSTKKARKELAEKQAKFFKKKVVFVKADGPFSINGVMVPNIADTIFVDIRTAKPFDAIMAHELSHWMEQEKPEVYKQMVKSLKQVIKDDATGKYAKKYGIDGATKVDLTKEIVGDIMGDNFTEQSFWDKVAAANPEAFKDIAAAIIKWLKGIIVKAKANSMGSEEWVKDATKAQDIVAKAVAQYTGESVAAGTEGGVKFHKAFHGSPHDHNKFDTSKIGTGEGAQAYGYGHYFAESKDVAEWYRDKLSKHYKNKNVEEAISDGVITEDNINRLRGELGDGYTLKVIKIDAFKDSEGFYHANTVYSDGSKKEITTFPYSESDYASVNEFKNDLDASALGQYVYSDNEVFQQALRRGLFKPRSKGKLYEVELAPEQDEYLLWDKPLSEQSYKVKAALGEIGIKPDEEKAKEFNRRLSVLNRQIDSGGNAAVEAMKTKQALLDDLINYDPDAEGRDIYKKLGGDKKASEYLHSLGIRGIKYLDGSSRAKGEGAYNYVIFDDKDVSITAKFSRATAKLDAEYMAAVNSGDMEKAQQMVDSAAREKGYISGNDYRMLHQAPNRDDYNLATIKDAGIVPDDYWTHPHYYQNDATERSSFYKVKAAIDSTSQKLWLFRSVPKNVKDDSLRNGDWVSPSREYAQLEGEGIPGGYRIIAKRASLKDIWWDANSINELGYDDGKEYAYKNTKNNRKLLDAVTYDDEGNVIPLSKRFNSRKYEPQFSRAPKSLDDVEKSWDSKGIVSSMSERNGIITLNKIIVPKDSRNSGVGTAAMRELTKYADDTAQQIALTPTADFGGNKVKLQAFYKRFGFHKNNEFNVMESLIRDPEAAKFSRAPKLYSKLEQALEAASDKVFSTGPQVKLWLQSNAGKLGIKKDEIYWSGIDNWLDAQGKVSKQQVVEFVRNNGVKVEDVVMSRGNSSLPKHNYSQLNLPGGTDYKEIVVTVPNIDPYNADDSPHFGDAGQGKQIGWIRMNTRDGGLFIEELQSQRSQGGRKMGFDVVPPAPFVSTASNKPTTSYITLLMKKVLIEAVINDRASVSWTTGDQQSERYDLKVGGEWAQSMYGNEQGLNLQGKPSLMTQAANDIFKHVGSGKVENINGQPGFYITPEMKSKDLPLFSRIMVDGIERPTENSEGKSINNPVNFWKWFGDSEARQWPTSSRGDRAMAPPLVFYHGTKGDFNKFVVGSPGVNSTVFGPWETKRAGMFFTQDKKFAESFATQGDSAQNANVMPVYLKVENAIDLTSGFTDDAIIDALAEKGINPRLMRNISADQIWGMFDEEDDGSFFVSKLKELGYDGAIIVEPNTANEDSAESWVVFNPNQIKSAIGNNGDYSSTNNDIRFSFAGQNAETADKYALETAQQRIAAGDDQDTVRQETGWFKGVDGKWRFEINDSDASIKKPFPAKGQRFGDVYESVYEAKLKEGYAGIALGDILDHPKLFAAYPRLADLSIDTQKGSGASFRVSTSLSPSMIEVGEDVLMYDVLSTLLHEVQHGIQRTEGFATGGNFESARRVSADIIASKLKKLNGQIIELGKDRSSLKGGEYDENVKLHKALVSDRDALTDELEALKYDMAPAAKAYKRLAGEVEARNTQTRMGFTDEERRLLPPYSSQDIPDSDQILVYNGTEMRSEPSKPTPPDETRLRRFQRMNQDSFNRFTVIKEWLAENGQKLSDKADVYGAEERYHSMAANQLEDFREQQRNPLIEKIQKAGYTLGDIEVFLKMQHAQEANAQIRTINNDPAATAYGVADDEAAEYLAEAPKELATLANEFRDITEQTKKLRLDAGILNTDITGAWENTYKFYVPMKGESDATRGVGKGLKTNFKSKRRLGHSLRDEHVIENILMDHERAIMEVERNRVGKHLVMMAAEMQRPDILSIDQPEKRKVLKTDTAYTVEANGVVQGVFKSREEAKMFKQFYAASMPKVAPSAITINQTKDQRVIASASPMLAENEVNVYMNGHAIRVQINDELLARAYTKMGVEQFSDIVAAGRILNGYLSKVYTGYNPEFILTNMIRDFSSGTINLTGEQGFGMAIKALTNYLRMFTDLLKYAATNGKSSTKWIDAYRKNGGNTGAAYLSDKERLGNEVSTEYASYQGVLSNLKQGDTANAARAAGRKVFNATLKWIYNLNQAGENAMRLAAFKAMIDSGRTVNEAAKVAKNITVNFNRKGERQWAPALYLFYNASVQGTAATVHALGKGKHKGQAWALAGSMAAVGYMMAASFGGGSEDDWDEINDYTKERNMLIKSGDGYVKVPVPYGYGFFWNLGRNMADAQRTGEWGKMPWHLATSAISELTPFNDVVVGSDEEFRSDQVFMGFLPTAMKIVAQPVFNKQLFTGSELMPESQFDKSQPDRQKMFRGTKGTMYDEVAGWLDAAGMDVSPETLKYITRTGTGGAGSLVDTGISAAMLKSEGAELDTQEIPFVRKAYMELGIKDKRAAYYKVREEARTAAEEFNRARRDNDVAKMQTVLKDKKELIALDRYANKLAATIDAARDQQDAVRADKKLSVQEKRLKLKDMEATEAKFYDKYLDVFKTSQANK